MRYILDTHTLLWVIFEPNKLSCAAKDILVDTDTRKFVSIASVWEIAIKNRIGKLPLSAGFSGVLSDLNELGCGIVDIAPGHIEVYRNLSLLHRDPFDGIIVATALTEGMTIITADKNIQMYDAPWVW
ncbi:MAG: type II toxin-antitoxin system VapC family toxin [Defluviitaleaceae bacterium]|nr:type II toxin-antitoxin system VapC family toxin [Defluviitaleaceae bacterium]